MLTDQWLPAANAAHRRPATGWRFFCLTSLAVLLADQLSKLWAIWRLTDAMAWLEADAPWWSGVRHFYSAFGHPAHRAAVTVADSWFHLRYVENPGAAWGFLSRSDSAWRTPFFLSLSLAAMAFIIVYVRGVPAHHARLRVGLTLVFGGALGNFIDRIRLGYVIDFVDWHLGDYYTWPTFNVADAAISVGVGLLLLDTLLESRRS